MRIPIDYDNVTLPWLREECAKVLNHAWRYGRTESVEIWETSPDHYRIVLDMPFARLEDALDIIETSNCDPDYKVWAVKKEDLTERLTSKNLSGVFPRLIIRV